MAITFGTQALFEIIKTTSVASPKILYKICHITESLIAHAEA